MHKLFFIFVLFLVTSFNVISMEIESVSEDDAANITHLRESPPPPQQRTPPQISDEGSPLLFEIAPAAPSHRVQKPDVEELYDALNNSVFNLDDPYGAKFCRWTGRLIGACAENAIVPMILYVFLGLLDAPTSGWTDWLIIGVMLAYLLPPASEKCAQMGQDFYDYMSECCSNEPRIPPIYKGINPWTATPLSVCSKLHAASMAIILVNIFHDIEHEFDWFFWSFFAQYALATYSKNNSFFNYGQMIEKSHQVAESEGQKKTRFILMETLKKFAYEDLRTLSRHDLKELYDTLRNKHVPVEEKLGKIRQVSLVEMQNQVQGAGDLSLYERTKFARPWTLKGEVADQVTNIAFYGSILGEYFIYQYGIGLFCVNLGLENPAILSAISNVSATILSGISFLFESNSVKKFYHGTFDRKFRSSDSASNPNIRRFVGVGTFFTSSIISLSEVYSAWEKTIAGSSVAYPLLVFMAIRHHARNTYWLRGGYELVFNNWHGRDCWRDVCCVKRCQRGQSREEMINLISVKFVNGLMNYIDQLNAQGVFVVYGDLMGHEPVHN